MNKPPPVPPKNRSPKGTGSAPEPKKKNEKKPVGPSENLAEQGDQANIYQNTHNQGYQQDR
jgi:hypothetical protein